MARLWYLPTLIIALCGIVGPAGAYLRVLDPPAGFGLLFLAIMLSLLSLPAMAGAAAFASATGKAWRGRAVRAAVVPLLVVVGVVLPNGSRLEPRIHDITTDPEDTLQFTPDVAARSESMPRDQVLALQREAYPDLEPLRLDAAPEPALERVEATAARMPGWEIVRRDPGSGRIEAQARSTIFRFVDDVVIRVQPDASGAGSRVDVRSRSRFGQSDLGANAARIRAFLAALAQAS